MVKDISKTQFTWRRSFEQEQCSPKSLIPPNNGMILNFDKPPENYLKNLD